MEAPFRCGGRPSPVVFTVAVRATRRTREDPGSTTLAGALGTWSRPHGTGAPARARRPDVPDRRLRALVTTAAGREPGRSGFTTRRRYVRDRPQRSRRPCWLRDPIGSGSRTLSP